VRTAAGAACLGLIGALAIAPGSGWIDGSGDRAQAAECTWQRHSRQVVKHVRRHRRSRRVALIKHWWSCDEAPAGEAAPGPTPTSPVPTSPQTKPEAEPEANTVGVSSYDSPEHFTYELSRNEAKTGEVTIELNNRGEDPHNLNLRAEGSEERLLEFSNTQPGHHQSATINLPPGTYHLWCSLPTHEAKGMQATLVVAP
jgi:plastocyanin